MAKSMTGLGVAGTCGLKRWWIKALTGEGRYEYRPAGHGQQSTFCAGGNMIGMPARSALVIMLIFTYSPAFGGGNLQVGKEYDFDRKIIVCLYKQSAKQFNQGYKKDIFQLPDGCIHAKVSFIPFYKVANESLELPPQPYYFIYGKAKIVDGRDSKYKDINIYVVLPYNVVDTGGREVIVRDFE